jgi:hypothetical protein
MTVRIDVSEMTLEEVKLTTDDFSGMKFFFDRPNLDRTVLVAENSVGRLELANSASFDSVLPEHGLSGSALSSDSSAAGTTLEDALGELGKVEFPGGSPGRG